LRHPAARGRPLRLGVTNGGCWAPDAAGCDPSSSRDLNSGAQRWPRGVPRRTMRPRLGAAVPASATPGRLRLPRRRAASCATNSLLPANSGSQPLAKRCHGLHDATPTQDAAIPVRDEGRGLRTAALVLRICSRPRDAAPSDSGGTTGHPRFGGAKCGYGAGRAAESDTESMAGHQHPESGT